MKRIDLNKVILKNDYFIENLVRGVDNMEFIKYGDKWLVKDSPGIIVSDKEKLQLEKKELILKDIEGCECQRETTKKISKINKKLKEHDTIKETDKSI